MLGFQAGGRKRQLNLGFSKFVCLSYVIFVFLMHGYLSYVSLRLASRWRGGATGRALEFVISRSWVQMLLRAMLRNNLGQVVYTYVRLSPSSITWYRPKGGDALWLGR